MLRCIKCGRIEELHDCAYVEPINGTDVRPVYSRGWICEDCEVIHIAWRFSNSPISILKLFELFKP